jgi:RHS repeat-associated protein
MFGRGDGFTRGASYVFTAAPSRPLVRFVGLVCLVGVVLLALGVGSASADTWTVESGTHQLRGEGGGLIKSWSALEWRLWSGEVNAVGVCSGLVENCASLELAGKTPVEAVSSTTAENAQKAVEHERRSFSGAEPQDAIDLAGEDVGALPYDLGAVLVAPVLELVENEHHAYSVLVEIGSGLDQMFRLPTDNRFSAEELEKYGSEGIQFAQYVRSFSSGELRTCDEGKCTFETELELPSGEYDYTRIYEQLPLALDHYCDITEDGKGTETCYDTSSVVPGFTLDTYKQGPEYISGGEERIVEFGWAHRSLPECHDTFTGLTLEINSHTSCTTPLGIPYHATWSESLENENYSKGITRHPNEGWSPRTASPSELTEAELRQLSENAGYRESLEALFPNKTTEERELTEQGEEQLGASNGGEPNRTNCLLGHPVNCATGNETQTQTDLAVGGRGPTFALSLTYNSQAAVKESTPGPFGFGWTGSYSAHLELKSEGTEATIYQDNGSTVTFVHTGGSSWTASSGLVQATLSGEGSGYVYTLPDQIKLHFNSSGQLTSEEDRNGNTLTMAYESGRLASITDGASRKITLTYNSEGRVESAKDPMGHTVKYTYESGNLASVTLPGETKANWQYKYNTEHELTSEADGREHTTTTEYNGAHQVIAQTDPLSRKRTWAYTATETGSETTITEPNGSKTVEQFNEYGSPTSITHASGTSYAATTTDEYNGADELIAQTDPNSHKTEYGYDSSGDRTSEKNAAGNERKWTFDSKHDIETETTPRGETTTIERDSHGNATKVSRPAPGETSQVTKYKYDSHGDVESMTNPLGREYKYECDSYGDRTAETDPEGNKRTWAYNEGSQETSTVSPRGHTAGAKESSFTTKLERDAQGRLIKVTNPLKREAKYAYDADGNVATAIDLEGNETKYTYDADNEPIKTEEPNKTITETEYNSEGQVVAQIDGNKHTTKYTRNLLGEVTEETNPLSQKTTKEYDLAGNLTNVTDPLHRTTTYVYDPANRLTEVKYSDGKTPTAKYEYNADGDRTVMNDGTGETVYAYDQLDRMIESKDGHGNVVKYEYNLANEPTKITYPNGKAVTRAYDKDARLESVTDWNEHTTSFAYDPDSDLKTITYPTGTSDVDSFAYENNDALEETKMAKGSETLASLVYTRDKDTQLTKSTNKGVPGEEKLTFSYDENSRLTKGAGIAYTYDNANNPTKIGSATYAYNSADELETATVSKKIADTYTYNEASERTKTTPSTGPATTYGYDQAGNLTSVTRPKEGETPTIEDTYTYNGEGLRTGETISGTTNYLTWDAALELPLILSNGTESFVYGPEDMPIEQINTEGKIQYLHHDQQGSTRLITGPTGTAEGTVTYGPNGTILGSTGSATTPLGYDAQYTSTDTGLIYMRARTYDPTTAQFLSVDSAVSITREPYVYSGDDPVNEQDRTGLAEETVYCAPWGCVSAPGGNGGGPGQPIVESVEKNWHEFEGGTEAIGEEVGSIWNEVTGGSGGGGGGRSRSLPREGEPNGTGVIDRGNGSGQIRDYGPNGEPLKDFDFGHDHGAGDPHVHDWEGGIRQPGRPLGPCD